MTASLVYCPVCGAANTAGEEACFACQQELTGLTGAQGGLLQGRYQLLTQVGAGGFGAVYEARDTHEAGKIVAIKQINLRGLTPAEMIDATDGFNREVQILSQLKQRHLPRVHGQFTDPDHWYVVMDFIDGETLEEYLQQRGVAPGAIRELGLDEVLDIALQLCDVLTYLHEQPQPIIFRDLKPANIMRTPRGQLYLIDFGIARVFKPGQTRDTGPLGSPGYASPEQYGRAQTDQRADVYSLGALLHHLLSRQDPADSPFAFAVLRAQDQTGQAQLNRLVRHMVATDAHQRPPNMRAVEAELRAIRTIRQAVEPRIWRPAPGEEPPAPGSARMLQLQQVLAKPLAAAPGIKPPANPKRRKLIKRGLIAAGTLALAGAGTGFGVWKYWHPSGLDLVDSSMPYQLPVVQSPITTLAWANGGQALAVAMDDGRVIACRSTGSALLTTSSIITPGDRATPTQALAWSENALRLARLANGAVSIYVADQNLISQSLPAEFTAVTSMAWAPDGSQLAVNDAKGLQIIDTDDLTATSLTISIGGTTLLPTSENLLTWSPNNQFLAFPNADGNGNYQVVITTVDGTPVSLIQLGMAQPTALAWSPDSLSLALETVDGSVEVWNNLNADPNTLQPNNVFSKSFTSQQSQLAWSPDGHFLALIDDANTLSLLDRSTGNTLATAPINDAGVYPGRALVWLDAKTIGVANSNLNYWYWTINWF